MKKFEIVACFLLLAVTLLHVASSAATINVMTIYCTKSKPTNNYIENPLTGSYFTYTLHQEEDASTTNKPSNKASNKAFNNNKPSNNKASNKAEKDNYPLDSFIIGKFKDQFNSTGWMHLHTLSVTSSTSECGDNELDQVFGHGIAEGYLTKTQIYHFFQNQYSNWKFTSKKYKVKESIVKAFGLKGEGLEQVEKLPNTNYFYPKALLQFMKNNYGWIESQITLNSNSDNYWKQIGNIYMQFNGLVQGYLEKAKEDKVDKELSWIDLYILNAAGDMETLEEAIHDKNTTRIFSDKKMMKKANNKANSKAKASNKAINKANNDNGEFNLPDEPPMTDCSALVKLSSDCLELFSGHTTWRGYNIINKMWKVYDLRLSNVASNRVSFASSPSFQSSKDDFYIMNPTGLVSMETTNSIFNLTLYDKLTYRSVFTWMRSILANRLATNGDEWTNLFARYNSGTYNNQWMVVDYKLFTPGQCNLKPGTLWIIEQIPGLTLRQDVTPILTKQTFWSSYNIPYFQQIYNISGYIQAKNKYGNEMDYNLCSRAQIFKREQAKVQSAMDWRSFGRVLQFNEFESDPLSKGDPANAISSRYDLRKERYAAFGGIDTKLTYFSKLWKENSGYGICGPTHQSLKPFTWKDSRWNGIVHLGQPEVYDFDWIDLHQHDL